MKKKFINFLKKLIALSVFNQNSCRIVEINTRKQEVVFHIKNRAIFIKSTFSEAIADLSIIDGLYSSEACWLGGYFGRALRSSFTGGDALKKAKSMSFLLKNARGQYQILFQNRSDEVGYYDKKTKKEYLEHPLTIANNEYIISRFDPSQACYIGILAGISMEKAILEPLYLCHPAK